MTLLRFPMGGRDKVCRHVSIPSTVSLPCHRSSAASAVACQASHADYASSRCAARVKESAAATDVRMVDVGDGQDGGGLGEAGEGGGGSRLQEDASAAGKLIVPCQCAMPLCCVSRSCAAVHGERVR